MLQITFVEVKTSNKSLVIQRNQLKTSDYLALQFHFPGPQTSRLPADPSVSPQRNFSKSTPNCLPLINHFPEVVPSQCHDFSYPGGQFHCLFRCFSYPMPHLPKPHGCFILNLPYGPDRVTYETEAYNHDHITKNPTFST